MLKVMGCIAQGHDLSFVMIAALVCAVGSFITIKLFCRTSEASNRFSVYWSLLIGMSGGATIWATHFVSMLGFQTSVDHVFDLFSTGTALLIATAGMALGLHISAGQVASLPRIAGGAVMGLAAAIMHYSGMYALRLEGHIEWDRFYFTGSIFLSVGLGMLTIHVLSLRHLRFRELIAAFTLVMMICGMHFTGMAAAQIIPDPAIIVPPSELSHEFLAVLVLAIMAATTIIVHYFADVGAQRETVAQLRHAICHDPLTGLPNRAYLTEYMPELLTTSAKHASRVAFIVIDLDRFKEVNDVYGHHAGDLLLQKRSTYLKACLQPGEVVARIGGDEFVAIKEGVTSQADTSDFIARLMDAMKMPVGISDLSSAIFADVGTSMGVSLFPDHGATAEKLLGAADLAMYRAKTMIGNSVCFYDSAMDERRRVRSTIAAELRHAIERQEFDLHYQPQFDVRSGQINGYEALLRWHHGERGMISPGTFIPIAEETGIILPIGEWVLRTACAEAMKWDPRHRISVNISSAQLAHANLAKTVADTLRSTGLCASRLELEVTEASIIEDREGTLQVMRQLKAIGVSLAMDDYGTGYSSLSTLQIFPFDKVKIDQSFVAGITTDRASAAIVRATILLATSLDISVLAEGVERQDQLDFLKAAGCDEVQGFLLGRPKPRNVSARKLGRLDAAARVIDMLGTEAALDALEMTQQPG